MASRSRCQQNSLTVEPVDDTYMIVGQLYPSNSISLICCGFAVQLVSLQLFSSRQHFDWHSASRGPSAVAEFLFFLVLVLSPKRLDVQSKDGACTPDCHVIEHRSDCRATIVSVSAVTSARK